MVKSSLEERIINWLADFFSRFGRHRALIEIVIYLTVISPVLVSGWIGYLNAVRFSTELAVSRRESLVVLSTVIVRERLDHLVDVGRSLAGRVRFRELVADGKWDEAVKILSAVPADFPYVERVFLTDPSGIETAAFPLLPEAIGQNFSYRDWYRGVSEKWEPYVSEVYIRAPSPRLKVVAIAIPIKNDSGGVIGILVMQIRAESFFEWIKDIDAGEGGFVYIVDRRGRLLVHPGHLSQAEVVDYSAVSPVDKLIRGETGIEMVSDQSGKRSLVAFMADPKYGWGVVISQPSVFALAERNFMVASNLKRFSFLTLLSLFIAFLLIRFIFRVSLYRRREKVLLESVGDGVFAIDRKFTITFWNRAAEKLTGHSAAEAVGKSFREVIKFLRKRDRSENVVFIEEAMLFGKTRFMEEETFFVSKDGREVPVGDSAAPIFGAAGDVIGAIVVFRDVSGDQEAKIMRSDFAYASHQFRTPVNKAMWNIELSLASEDLNSERKKIETAYAALRSVRDLAENLLEASKIDQKLVYPKFLEVKLAELLSEITGKFAVIAGKKGVVVEVGAVPAASSIKTDPNLLSRIVSEIVSNAVSFSDREDKVGINVSFVDNDVVIECRDTGIGIPEEHKPLVFTKFFRSYNFNTDERAGSGLGLFIARSYVSLLGGRIWFESEVGKGTAFYVRLPLSGPPISPVEID